MRFSLTTLLTLAVLLAAWQPGEGQGLQREAPVTGRVHALTIFARFQEENSGGEAIPDFAREIFAAERPGSLTHFYGEMSRGQFALTGECLSRWYAVDRPTSAYLPPEGDFGNFVAEILDEVDAEIDFGQYDNDGPDGIANSGDDDGYVDFVFVVTRSAPPDFVFETATGIAALGLSEDRLTADTTPGGRRIRVRGDNHEDGVGGVLQQGHTFEAAVGSMAHEFGHFLELVDLYDLGYIQDDLPAPEEDSAGIGYWGLMGHGNRGWGERGGPNPLSAWSLKRLGWLGVENGQLIVLQENVEEAFFEDVNAGGWVYQLPVEGEEEYYLVEFRRRGNSYYERNLPGEGLLVWHIRENSFGNDAEESKRVDLVCADGLYLDAGYPQGELPAAEIGRDNLDFWAHDESYRAAHAGNLGDAGDLFDGERFTDFWAASNPAAPAGISVTGIRREGEWITARLKLDDRRRAGRISVDEIWTDTVEVVGDVTVMAGARLSIRAGTVVLFSADLLGGGADARRTELVVQGELSVNTVGGPTVRFTSAATRPQPGDWRGIALFQFSSAVLRQVVVEYAVEGLAGSRMNRPLELRDVVVRHSLGDGIRLEGIDEPVTLTNLQVHQSGGRGARIEGNGLVEISFAHMSDNRGGGLERVGGFLGCRDSRFVNNGAEVDTAANLTLGAGVFGTVSGNTFSGGVGLRCVETREVLVADNQFDGNRVGMVSSSARPRVSGNQFLGSQLVFQILGFAVPSRMDLNVVQEAGTLLENKTQQNVTAINNWWGRTDAEWIAERMSGQVTWQPFLNFDPRQPVAFSLAQNFPNPFNGSTVIRYTVGINEPVVTGQARTVVEVRNIVDGLVRRLVDEPAAPGIFEVTWDGRDEQGGRVASGVYYYQLLVGPISERRRLLFLK